MSVVGDSNVATDGIEPYALPLMEGRVVTRHGEVTTGDIPTAQDIASLLEQSKAEGYSAGYAEGLAQAKEEVDLQIEVLSKVANELESPLNAIDEEVIQSIAALVGVVSKNIIRRQFSEAPDEVVGVVREAVKQLPLSERAITIRLHPGDLDVLRQAVGEQSDSQGWGLQADQSLSRGGCIVNTDVSTVDASLETRIGQIISTMIGDERKNEG